MKIAKTTQEMQTLLTTTSRQNVFVFPKPHKRTQTKVNWKRKSDIHLNCHSALIPQGIPHYLYLSWTSKAQPTIGDDDGDDDLCYRCAVDGLFEQIVLFFFMLLLMLRITVP